MSDPGFGCRWEYKGKDGWVSCEVRNVIIADGKVVGLIINTGVGPDIKASLDELAYELDKS